MNFVYHRKRISGMLSVVPANERLFVEEMKNYNFPMDRSLKLMEVMGYQKRRLVKEDVCVSDLAIFGLKALFEKKILAPEDIDALILVTQTPDYITPPTSNIIQGKLGLKRDMVCLDINQACAGFLLGMMQAFMLLEQDSVKKVVLINSDVLSRKASPSDRTIYPLIGDAASITIIERDSRDSVINAALKMDGSRSEALMIPAGGMRLPSSPATALLEDVGDKNLRGKDHLRMDGSAIFNFVQVEVPPLIEQLLRDTGRDKESIDYFFCHQPNRFMLQKLADKMRVPHQKMPNNVVENFGNSSGATIPVAIISNISAQVMMREFQVCLAGFGSGLAWAAMLMPLGNLNVCELIDYPD
jgi:3-oxoacyl-[acyl-carrier-protein] synthase-3